MSSNSQMTLRNGKTLTCTNSVDSTKLTHGEEIANIENNNENSNEQAQLGQGSSDCNGKLWYSNINRHIRKFCQKFVQI